MEGMCAVEVGDCGGACREAILRIEERSLLPRAHPGRIRRGSAARPPEAGGKNEGARGCGAG
jgi:hypothetical protein